MKSLTLLLGMVIITGCMTSVGSQSTGPGSRDISRWAVLHEGPELVATLVHPSGQRSVGDEWLILAAELTAADGSGPIIVKRTDISVRTPDGRRLPPVSQDEFRSNFPRIKIPLERSLAFFPLLDRYKPNRVATCDRWYFVAPPGLLAVDQIPISSSQICSGPLVFRVPGGIQPGRWRLIIELEESRADIPFTLEVED